MIAAPINVNVGQRNRLSGVILGIRRERAEVDENRPALRAIQRELRVPWIRRIDRHAPINITAPCSWRLLACRSARAQSLSSLI